MDLLTQRDRVYLRDAGVRVPVLAAGSFVTGPEDIEVSFDLRAGGKVSFRGRLLAHWVVGSVECPATFREEPGDLVLAEVVRGGRVAVRTFVRPDAGVMLLLLVRRELQ
jgi:hypothetical protein